MVKLEARLEDDDVIISKNSFEHLLNCLDNQKYIHEVNADASTCDYKKIQKESQEAIDNFNRQCRILLHGLCK